MWKYGRQNSGYKTLTLWKSTRLKTDGYIIHYPDGSHIPPHTDPASPGYAHHRVNIILKPPTSGGAFQCDTFKKWGPIIYFRPDLYEHSVTPCQGSRWIFSFGWLKKEKPRAQSHR